MGRAAGPRGVLRLLLAARRLLPGGCTLPHVSLPRTAYAFRTRSLLVHCSESGFKALGIATSRVLCLSPVSPDCPASLS